MLWNLWKAATMPKHTEPGPTPPSRCYIDGQIISPEVRERLKQRGVEFNADGEPVPKFAADFALIFEKELRDLPASRQRVVQEAAEAIEKGRRHANGQ